MSAPRKDSATAILAIVLAVIAVAGCSSDQGGRSAPAPVHHWLLLTCADDDYSELADDRFSLGGGEVGGELIVWVNCSPILLHGFGGTLVRVSEWLEKGTNTVEVRGRHKRPMVAKILESPNRVLTSLEQFIDSKVTVKTRCDPADECTTMEFTIENPIQSPAEALPDKEQRGPLESELRQALKGLEDNIRGGRFEEAFQWLSETEYPKDLALERETETERKSRIAEFSAAGWEMVDHASSAKIIWGKRSVLVYTGWVDRFVPIPYLFRLERRDDKNHTGHVPPLRLVRIDSKWREW